MGAVTVRAATASLNLSYQLVTGEGSAVAVDEVEPSVDKDIARRHTPMVRMSRMQSSQSHPVRASFPLPALSWPVV